MSSLVHVYLHKALKYLCISTKKSSHANVAELRLLLFSKKIRVHWDGIIKIHTA